MGARDQEIVNHIRHWASPCKAIIENLIAIAESGDEKRLNDEFEKIMKGEVVLTDSDYLVNALWEAQINSLK